MTQEPLELTEQDLKDLAEIAGEDVQPAPRAVLSTWDELLKAVDTVIDQPIPALVAHKVVTSWPKLSYQDTAIYHRIYHGYMGDAAALLHEVVLEHPEALKRSGAEDGELNREHYIDLLVGWNLLLDAHEEAWRAEHPESHIQIAALTDVRATIFGGTGMAAHLEAISFQLRDEEFFERLQAAKEDL